MDCNIKYKDIDGRNGAVVKYLMDSYNSEQITILTASLMNWAISNLKYESTISMFEILKDFILGKESAFEAILNKDIEEMPLYINHGNPISKSVSVWRLLCGK